MGDSFKPKLAIFDQFSYNINANSYSHPKFFWAFSIEIYLFRTFNPS
nr:MAG TPA: hypothetical protein [Caudoviricetes sp.]